MVPCRFGRFVLEPERRLLTSDGAPVALSSRAFDILALLIEHRDRVVTKDQIFAAVWPGTVVEENNLAVQISALRRALGEPPGDPKIVATIPGRGYRFIAPIELPPEPAPELPPPVPEALANVSQSPGRAARRTRLWFAVAACAIAAAWIGVRLLRPAHVAPRLSIVVLPFRNLSADRQQDYLADAISDDLTTDLSHLPGSVVIARESADSYRGRAVPAGDIGRALNVRYLLEGSLRVEADIFHVNAQLIDAPTGTHLWADRFDVTRDKLGAAQEQIVRHIASALNFTLVQIEAARSLRERPDNPDAVDFFLRARSVLDQGRTMPRLVAAQALLEKAVELAPDFADARAELGLLLVLKIGAFDDPDEWRDHAAAKQHIERAMQLAPRSPIAIIATGMLAWEDGRCDQAQPSFRLALALDPNNVRALTGLESCSRELGHMQEMIDEIRDIIRIDPLGPAVGELTERIGMGYLMLGKPAEALEYLNQAGAGTTDGGGAATALGWQEWRQLYQIAAYEELGDHARAASLYADYDRRYPHRTVWRLASYYTHATAVLPGHAAYLAALKAAGMPRAADEAQDFGVPVANAANDGGDFDPTPVAIPGAKPIDSVSLHALVGGPQPVRIFDLGTGAAVIPGSVLVWPRGVWGDQDRMFSDAINGNLSALDQPVVVMATGPFGWTSYNGALHLISLGYRNVFWYRGGEEAWASAGYGSEDRRPL